MKRSSEVYLFNIKYYKLNKSEKKSGRGNFFPLFEDYMYHFSNLHFMKKDTLKYIEETSIVITPCNFQKNIIWIHESVSIIDIIFLNIF